jgi:hypothetical protein
MSQENFRYISNDDPVKPVHDANMMQRFLAPHGHIEIRKINTHPQDDLIEHHRLLQSFEPFILFILFARCHLFGVENSGS